MKTVNLILALVLLYTFSSCEIEDCGDFSQTGSSLDLSSACDLLSDIWGPGSNSITIGGILNLSTQPGVGWSQEYGGKYVSSFSIVGNNSYYITTSTSKSVKVEGPANSVIEVMDLETLAVISTNINNPGSPVIFTAETNKRYGGFAWYSDNAKKDMAISAVFN